MSGCVRMPMWAVGAGMAALVLLVTAPALGADRVVLLEHFTNPG